MPSSARAPPSPSPPHLPRQQGGYGVEPNITHALALFHNATDLGSWRAPHQTMLILADGLHGAPKDPAGAADAFWRFMAQMGGWKKHGQAAAARAAEGDHLGAAVRYALLAEQGSLSAVLNLAWLMHRGQAYRLPDRHSLALGLWERGVARGQVEGVLMAGHLLLEGHKYGLQDGERARAGGRGVNDGAARAAHRLPNTTLPHCCRRRRHPAGSPS